MPSVARRRGSGAVSARQEASSDSANALDAIWGALNIARDNKALVLATGGLIVNINQLASDLCERSDQDLVGRCVITELFENAPVRLSAGASGRWETGLKTASGLRIPVEVRYERLGTGGQQLEVYAIRDLRERLGNAARIESFNLRPRSSMSCSRRRSKGCANGTSSSTPR